MIRNMGRRGNKKRNEERGRGKKSGLHQSLSIGTLAFVIAVIMGGPIGAVLQKVDVITGVLIMVTVIFIAILADIIAVAAAAAQDVPFNAMASDRVPGAQEALYILRNAGRVNSIFADIIGDIAGTITGVVATPVIFALSSAYPDIPQVVVSAVVIGLIAFLTIGGKAAEKDFAVRQSTAVILWIGKIIYAFKRMFRVDGRKKHRKR